MTDHNKRDRDALEHVERFIAEHGLEAEIILPGSPTPTVPLAARALGVSEDQILKSLLFVSAGGKSVVAIASGNQRISTTKLEHVTGLTSLKLAKPNVVLRLTGFPAGGVAPIGLPAGIQVVVDESTSQLETVFGGAGTDEHMLRINPSTIVAVNAATVADISGD